MVTEEEFDPAEYQLKNEKEQVLQKLNTTFQSRTLQQSISPLTQKKLSKIQ